MQLIEFEILLLSFVQTEQVNCGELVWAEI